MKYFLKVISATVLITAVATITHEAVLGIANALGEKIDNYLFDLEKETTEEE